MTAAPVRHNGAKRADLEARIGGLSRDECDSVVLRLELVPREDIFDRSIDPKALLFRYTRHATSREELEYIERTLDDRR